MDKAVQFEKPKAQDATSDTASQQLDSNHLLGDSWSAPGKPGKPGDKAGNLEKSAEVFVQNLGQASTDAEIAQQFKDFVAANKDQPPINIAITLSDQLQKANAPFRFDVQGDAEGTKLILAHEQKTGRGKTILEGQYLKPGQDRDQEFNPDDKALKKIADQFASENPENLPPEQLQKRLDKVMDDMRQAGAGPSDAKHAINDSFEAFSQSLKLSANRKGEYELDEYHSFKPLVTVTLPEN